MSDTKQSLSQKPCIVQQKQPGLSALRLKATGGNLTTDQLRAITNVADKYGAAWIHLSTRQGVEIHNIRDEDLQAATGELEAGGVLMGAGGAHVRIVVACPGDATCRYGAIETRHLAQQLDRAYYGDDMPHKFKFGIVGCPNNCGKAREADLGIMGATIPAWDPDACNGCGLCIPMCPVDAITEEDGEFHCDMSQCILCSVCVVRCPEDAWIPAKRGITILIGGTMGRQARLGIPLKRFVEDEQELMRLVEQVIAYYRANGKPKERLGHMMERMGEQRVIADILAAAGSTPE